MILDAKARITMFCTDFFGRLQSVGCGSFPEDNPKKSMRLLFYRIEPPALRKEMKENLEFDESLEISVRRVIKVLT